MSSETPMRTLYDRLGGVYSIATVVDDFIDRVMNNPILNANAAVDEAHHRVSAAGFKYYVTEMVCWAAGGPQTYTGPRARCPRVRDRVGEGAVLIRFSSAILPPYARRKRFCSQTSRGAIFVLYPLLC